MPDAKLPEVTREISKLWKSMPKAEKDQRLKTASAASDAYKAAKEVQVSL
jgi:hypothetical protein